MPVYKTKVVWKGGHYGELICGNGTQMSFSAPPALQGRYGVMTPEDAYVSALNTCFHMMFIWATERLKIELVSYECEAEGHVVDLLDRTSKFERMVLRPIIEVKATSADRVGRALQWARKYSLIANSITAPILIEPKIESKP
ncbi:MAG: OsmC family protein [Candidatus Bathyarchaeia archaeon]|jgi:organic hydroperoxide reductase OsmC/OhrA